MNPLDDVLGLLGLSGTPEANLKETALQLSQLEPVDLGVKWWAKTYASDFGPWALLIALIVSALVLLTNVGPHGNRLKLLLSPVIYGETLLVYFLIPPIQQLLNEASRQIVLALLPTVFQTEGAATSFLINLLTNLTFTGWVQFVTLIASEFITIFASVLDRLLYAIPYALVMAWPLRYLGRDGGGAGLVASVIRFDFVILLTAPTMLLMLAVSQTIITNGSDDVVMRRYAVMIALILTAWVPFWLNGRLKSSMLIKGIKDKVTIRGNVGGGSGAIAQGSTPALRASRRQSLLDNAGRMNARQRNIQWMMERPSNFAKTVFARDPRAQAAITAGSWLASKIKK